jgi:sugar phosphate isomerase/epimerase
MTANTSPFAVNTYSYTLTQTVTECVTRLADRGYVQFELMMYPGHLWPADMDSAARKAFRRLLESRALKVTTLNMPNVDLNVAGAAAEMRAYTLSLLRGVVQLAGDLGVPGVIVGPGKPNPLFPAPKERLMGHFYAALDDLVPLAEKSGTSIYVENMPFAFLPGIEELLAALDAYGNDKIGVVYDIANGYFIKEDIAAALRRARHRLKLVHLSDTGLQVYRHDPVGAGTVPFASVPAILKELNHREMPMLEIISTNADPDIDDSATKLLAMGWCR